MLPFTSTLLPPIACSIVLSAIMFFESKATPVDDSIPSPKAVAQAMNCSVKDSRGESHLLSALVKTHKRTIFIMVRHHHCQMCMMYIRLASKRLLSNPSTSKDSEETTQVIVIGHGSWQGIQRYKETSNCAFEMYSDEEKNIYKALGMTRRFLGNRRDTKRASYIEEGQSTLSITMSSIGEMITSGSLFWKGGDFALLGGEFVFEGGEWGKTPVLAMEAASKVAHLTPHICLPPESNCLFVHRMRDTQDHTDIKVLEGYVR